MTTVLRSVAGKRVRIFCKPITEEEQEGVAKLVKLIWRSPDFDRWIVRFDDDEETYERMIRQPYQFVEGQVG